MTCSDRERVVVLGIGNVLLSDEGVGVRVVRELEHERLPECVELVDGGTAGLALADIVSSCRHLIVVDAIRADEEPGTVLEMKPEEIGACAFASSPHGIGLMDVLRLVEAVGPVPETLIFGVVPEKIDWGEQLSGPVSRAARKVARRIVQKLSSLC